MTLRKGIILAAGSGNGIGLSPATTGICQQLLPVYDVPMIYFPLTTLMRAGIRDILIISTPEGHQPRLQAVLGDGSQWGINLQYAVQPSSGGLGQAFLTGKEFINNSPSALVLGNNIFFGHDFQKMIRHADEQVIGATVFAYHVRDPQRYGVVTFDQNEWALSIEDRPQHPQSNYAETGLYFYDTQVCHMASELKPSARGALEITDINRRYLEMDQLVVKIMGRGHTWLDIATHDSLLEAGQYIATIEKRQGLKVACPEEVAYRAGWIDAGQLERLAQPYSSSEYGQYLQWLQTEKVY